MRIKGSKNKAQLPSRYEGGTPAVNFWLAILLKAKKDSAQMWLDFEKTELCGRNIDPVSKAWWVSNYLEVKDD